MGYYSDIVGLDIRMEKITTIEKFRKLLTTKEKKFIDNWYDDLTIVDGVFQLRDYNRKNYDSDNWVSILRKIAKIEGRTMELKFIGEDNECWGYRLLPNGKLLELTQKWVIAKR